MPIRRHDAADGNVQAELGERIVVPALAQQHIGGAESVNGTQRVVDVAKMARIVGEQQVDKVRRLAGEIVSQLFGRVQQTVGARFGICRMVVRY